MSPVELTQAWMDALNQRDAERLLVLSWAQIEIIGPKGTGRGHPMLLQWLARAGATFHTVKIFCRGDTVVMEQVGTWVVVPTDVPGRRSYQVASVFRCNENQIRLYARHSNLAQALTASELSDADEVRHTKASDSDGTLNS